MTYYGIRIAFGLNPAWERCPIAGLPSDTIRVRRKFRPTEPARIYVRTPNKIAVWLATPTESGLALESEIATNLSV